MRYVTRKLSVSLCAFFIAPLPGMQLKLEFCTTVHMVTITGMCGRGRLHEPDIIALDK
jgi:hypothetical protein